MDNSILGIFQYVDKLLTAAERCKKLGWSITIISPVPLEHKIERISGEGKDKVRYFTASGAIAGLFFGMCLALGTAFLYALPRGGRPILAVTPTLLISFETTILFGVLMTLTGFLVLSKLPSYRKKTHHPVIEVDSFALIVDNVKEDKFAEVEGILRQYGASEVKRIEEK